MSNQQTAADLLLENSVPIEKNAGDAVQEWKNELIPFNRMMGFLSGTEWLVNKILCRNSIGTMFGDSGTMKSFVALDLGLSIACGLDYHGHKVHQGGVVYVCGENFHGTPKRVMAWCMENDIDTETEVPFFITRLPVALIDETSMVCLADDILKSCENPALIIVDTLSANFGQGDESSNSDVGQLLANVSTYFSGLGACVMFVHHVGHGAKDRERGAYALRANVDFRIQVDKPADSPSLTLTSLKVKDGALFSPIAFKSRVVAIPELFDSEGIQETSVVLDIAEYSPVVAAVNNAGSGLQLLAFTALADECKKRREELDKRGGAGSAWVPFEVWYQMVSKEYAAKGKTARKDSFKRSIDNMLKKEIVESNSGLYRVKE